MTAPPFPCQLVASADFLTHLAPYTLTSALLTAEAIVLLVAGFFRYGQPELLRLIRIGTVLLAAFLTLASLGLLNALLNDDFALNYVWMHSAQSLGLVYKVAAFWAGKEGSLLLWAWMLGLMGILMAWQLRKAHDRPAALTLGVMALVTGFFICLLLFAADPFTPTKGHFTDGRGLNPLLQTLAMVFHPPLLLLGYAAYTAPFAFMLGDLFARWPNRPPNTIMPGAKPTPSPGAPMVLDYHQGTSRRLPLDAPWLPLARPWMVLSWIMLTVGIVLGAQWAYMELGWGGYWAWDPVENASLLPWLTGTALLHSTILQLRRGTFKFWVAGLTAASFLLCIMGTYLTRSGVVSSVHAFGESSIGWYFLGFMALILIASTLAIVLRRQDLQAEQPLAALVSRDGFFLLGNVLLVVMMLITLLGTLSPLISAVFGQAIEAKPPFYNGVILPLALLLAALMATGPVLGSGVQALARAQPKLGGMLLVGAVAAVPWLRVRMDLVPLLWTLCTAVIVVAVLAGIGIDVYASLTATRSLTKTITQRHRHWGAQLAHLGMAAIVAGVAGSSLFGDYQDLQLRAGDEPRDTVGGYSVQLDAIQQVPRDNYTADVMTINLTSPKGDTFTLQPESRTYPSNNKHEPDQTKSVVALRSGLFSDLYLSPLGPPHQTPTLTILNLRVKFSPLINWIWLGGALLTLGGIVCLLPGRREEREPEGGAP